MLLILELDGKVEKLDGGRYALRSGVPRLTTRANQQGQGAAPGMKENVLDVLMYLFETYVDAEEDPEPDHNELRDELARAGFGDSEIDRALDWLLSRSKQKPTTPKPTEAEGAAA